MKPERRRGLPAFLLLAAATAFFAATARADEVELLARLAPDLERSAIAEALSAMACAKTKGIGTDAGRLAIIDYTRSSREKRFWVFDLQHNALLFEEHVAHGKQSGFDVPTEFSNKTGSYQSSLGLFLTDTTYQGANGYSLQLQGLNGPLNARALERRIVMHGAPYVDPDAAARMGRLGRSLGCPAVRKEVAAPMIDAIKQGQFLYIYGPGSAVAKNCDTVALASHADGTSPQAHTHH